MYPFEVWIEGGIEALFLKHGYAAVCHLDVWVRCPVLVHGRIYVWTWRFARFWVAGDLNLVSNASPVSALLDISSV